MKVYKKHTAVSETPYLDNCYVSATPNDPADTDVTNTKSLLAFVSPGLIDYTQYRDYCKQEILPNWASITEEEKVELVRHNIAPDEVEKMSRVSDAQHRINYFELLRLEKTARYNRWEKAKKYIAYEYRLNLLNQLLMYQDTKEYKDDYIDADLPYLRYWVESAAYPPLGIDFTTTGFSSKPYYLESIRDVVLGILIDNISI